MACYLVSAEPDIAFCEVQHPLRDFVAQTSLDYTALSDKNSDDSSDPESRRCSNEEIKKHSRKGEHLVEFIQFGTHDWVSYEHVVVRRTSFLMDTRFLVACSYVCDMAYFTC